jgi:acetyltransferase-like isoleucine patch superfamily enzyme
MIHPTAEVSAQARIGAGTRIWHYAQIREGVVIGQNCVIGKNVYIDFGVSIGDNVKIQNDVLVYHGLTIEDGVFIGPQACLTNDRYPRAITPDGHLKGANDWVVSPTLVRYGASIGASATILAGLTIGRFAMVGAGAVVTHSVLDHGLVLGVPARFAGYVCQCGRPLEQIQGSWRCGSCGWLFHPRARGEDTAGSPH